MFAFERGECLFVGLVLPGLGFLRLVGEAEFVEEDFAELFGRGDVECPSGVALDGLRQSVDLLLEFHADVLERVRVDGDALHFHADEHGQQRAFDLMEDFLLPCLREQRAEFRRELPCHVRILGGVFGELFQGDGCDVEILGGLVFPGEIKQVVGWRCGGG